MTRYDQDIAFMILLQASLIWFSETINGGEIRKQFGANRNQSVITPETIHVSMILLFVSKESNSTAIHKPNERIDLIFG